MGWTRGALGGGRIFQKIFCGAGNPKKKNNISPKKTAFGWALLRACPEEKKRAQLPRKGFFLGLNFPLEQRASISQRGRFFLVGGGPNNR